MAEAKWYVVHTYSGYENKVKANIEKTIENNKHLAEQILEVRVPLEDVVEIKNGAKRTVQKKMFPGYVLLNMEMNDDTWYVVRNTRGVTGFVGPGSKPVPLTEAEMKPLGIKAENVSVDYYPTEDDDKIAKIVCERLLPEDRISDVNRLCARLDGQWQITDEEFTKALSENDVRGALNIKAAYEKLREDLMQINDLSM